MMNFYAVEQLMLQQQRQIERSVQNAWQLADLPAIQKEQRSPSEKIIKVQPASACCAAACC